MQSVMTRDVKRDGSKCQITSWRLAAFLFPSPQPTHMEHNNNSVDYDVQEENYSALLNLSFEVIRTIISFLPAPDVAQLAATCLLLNDICNQESVWKEAFIREFPHSFNTGWKPAHLYPSSSLLTEFKNAHSSMELSNSSGTYAFGANVFLWEHARLATLRVCTLALFAVLWCVGVHVVAFVHVHVCACMRVCTDDDSFRVWKELFVCRWKIKRNWKNRKYKVYSLDVHTGERREEERRREREEREETRQRREKQG